METIKLTRDDLSRREDMGKDWYDWEGIDEEANVRLPGCNVRLVEGAKVDTHGGDIYAIGGNLRVDGDVLSTGGGDLHTTGGSFGLWNGELLTEGGSVYTMGGSLSVFDGSLRTKGGMISTGGGRLEIIRGDFNTGGGCIRTEGGRLSVVAGGLHTESGDVDIAGGTLFIRCGEFGTGGGNLVYDELYWTLRCSLKPRVCKRMDGEDTRLDTVCLRYWQQLFGWIEGYWEQRLGWGVGVDWEEIEKKLRAELPDLLKREDE